MENTKIEPVSKKNWSQIFDFRKKLQKDVPSFGFFRTKTLSHHKNAGKIITIDPEDPQSEKQILEIINTWQERPLEGKRFYSGTPWRTIAKRTAGVLGVIIAAAAAGAAYFYDRFLNMAHESKTPLPAQETYRYHESFYKYALDGEKVRTMDATEFLKELHSNGLTVADTVNIQCQIQEDETFEEIIVLADLTEHDQKLLKNIWNLRHSFFNGHYNKNNVTYKGTFDLPLRQVIDSTLEKADIPFKLTITDRYWDSSEDVLAGVGIGLGFNLKFNYHIETGTAGIKKNTLDLFLYVAPDLKSADPLFQKSIIAHEVTHILNLHRLQEVFFVAYLKDVKKAYPSVADKCFKLLTIKAEYQADLGPLSKLEYAQAHKHRSEGYKKREVFQLSDIYIPMDKMV